MQTTITKKELDKYKCECKKGDCHWCEPYHFFATNHFDVDKNYKKDKDHESGNVTLEVIKDLLKTKPINSCLELGGGTGLVTKTILDNGLGVVKVDVYEPLKECREMMIKTLKDCGYYLGYNLIDSYDLLPPKRNYDLIVVDGGKKPRDGGYPKLISAYIASLDNVKFIVIEGNRRSQKYYIKEALYPRYLFTTKYFPCSEDSSKGCTLIKCYPCGSFLLKVLNYIYQKCKQT